MMGSSAECVGPVNLGNPGELTMLQLAEMVIQLTGSSSRIDFHPLPQDDPKQRRPDISFATEALKRAPIVGLDTGLRQTIEYFGSLIRAPRVDSKFD